jgi:LysM repeat protein
MLRTARNTILALIAAIASSSALLGQVPVQISTEKIVSAGKVYYMHEVQKDQTLYSISRAYKVSIEDITLVNEIPSYGIVPGQVLRIPASEPKKSITTDEQAKEMARKREQSQPQPQPQQQPQPQPQPQPKTQPQPQSQSQSQPQYKVSTQKIVSNGKVYYLHEVEKGQTLYSIARTYKVTVDDVTRENVIASYGIAPGQVLKIPSSETPSAEPVQAKKQVEPLPPSEPQVKAEPQPAAQPQPQSSSPSGVAMQDEKEQAPPASAAPAKEDPEPKPEAAPAVKKPVQPEKKTHKVQKGESLSDIADKYEITVSELKQANKGLIFATPGMRLVIPAKEVSERDPKE